MSSPAHIAAMSPEAYWQESWLEREKRDIFFANWFFAGFAETVAKDNDYLSFTVAGLPVVVRNMKGKLVAFRNICSHRYSVIHPVGHGNDMFRCPFHGWTYNADGVPIGIPDNAVSFGLDKEAKCAHALDPVQVDRIGRFLFVRVAPEGPSLREWLGSIAADMEKISALFPDIYGQVNQVWDCNWKIGLEITVEGYHMALVHKEGFDKHIGGERTLEEKDGDAPLSESEVAASAVSPMQVLENAGISRIDYIGDHSFSTAPLSANSIKHLTTVAKRLHLTQAETTTNYDHYLICPNVMIGVNGGTNVCVERYEPLSPNQTRVECWLMTGVTEEKMLGGLIWQTITKQWTEWTVKVLGEDKTACEGFQRGVRHATHQALLGHCEDRVLHYQKALLAFTNRKEKAA